MVRFADDICHSLLGVVIGVRVPEREECALTSPVRTECGRFVMYCMQCCMSVSAVL